MQMRASGMLCMMLTWVSFSHNHKIKTRTKEKKATQRRMATTEASLRQVCLEDQRMQ